MKRRTKRVLWLLAILAFIAVKVFVIGSDADIAERYSKEAAERASQGK